MNYNFWEKNQHAEARRLRRTARVTAGQENTENLAFEFSGRLFEAEKLIIRLQATLEDSRHFGDHLVAMREAEDFLYKEQ